MSLPVEELLPEPAEHRGTWQTLRWTGNISRQAKITAMRLNALADPYFHGKVILGYDRMVGHLHGKWLKRLSDPGLHMVFEAPRDHFKALDVDTVIPTPVGMKLMGHIQVGDMVLGVDGQPVTVTGVSEINWRPRYAVKFVSGETILADADHLWETDTRKDRENSWPRSQDPKPSIKSTREIAESILCRRERNHRVRMAGAAYGENACLIPPYTLGAWLGDGHSESGTITVGDSDVAIVRKIEQEGFVTIKRKAKYSHGIYGLTALLGREGVRKNKHIPERYLFAPEASRMELLRGLMDTDGSVSMAGQCSFSNTNPRLVRQTRQLLCSLGFKPSPIGTYRARLNGEYVGHFHVVTFYAYPGRSPFHLARKTARLYAKRKVSMQGYRQIESVSPAGMGLVKCIMVDSPDRLYLAGEGYIPTHNTTCGTITLASWWALPFGDREEAWMRSLGYGDEWIRYMRRIHSAELKIAIASETEPNAILMGFRFDHHYQKNEIFREVFDDLIPGTGANWNQLIKTQNRSSGQGEGTFNMLGVGTVLQSRHFDRAIEDDLFGEEALYSESTRRSTIEWHQRLPGAFDTDKLAPGFLNLELVTGNRWGLNDLNGHIKENDPSFTFESHSAEGGCCADHPPGQSIFPEEFSMERLAALRVRFGIRSFSAHFLNQPVTEEECTFRKQWLPRFRIFRRDLGLATDGSPIAKTVIERMSRDGKEVYEDLTVAEMDRVLILDPNHGGEKGRARHAAIVVGIRKRADRRKELYLLDAWAKAVSHDAMIAAVGEMARRWRANKFFVETIAGQDGWMHYFERDMREKMPAMVVTALPKERGAGAKDRRITSMSPLYERGQVWVRATGGGSEEFLREYEMYPNAKTVDLLDCMGYCFNIVETAEVDMRAWQYMYERDMEKRRRSIGQAGY